MSMVKKKVRARPRVEVAISTAFALLELQGAALGYASAYRSEESWCVPGSGVYDHSVERLIRAANRYDSRSRR